MRWGAYERVLRADILTLTSHESLGTQLGVCSKQTFPAHGIGLSTKGGTDACAIARPHKPIADAAVEHLHHLKTVFSHPLLPYLEDADMLQDGVRGFSIAARVVLVGLAKGKIAFLVHCGVVR